VLVTVQRAVGHLQSEACCTSLWFALEELGAGFGVNMCDSRTAEKMSFGLYAAITS